MDNGYCHTEHMCSYDDCGIHNWECCKWIHSAGEHHRLGQEEENLFSGSDPHCFGNLQNKYVVVYMYYYANIFTLSRFRNDCENGKNKK